MNRALSRAVGVIAALSSLLLWAEMVSADDSPAAVQVSYAKGETEIDTLQVGVKCFANADDVIQQFPAQLAGLQFTRRPWKAPCDATIDAPAGSTVFVLVGVNGPAGGTRRLLASWNWAKLDDMQISGKDAGRLAVYGKTFATAQEVKMPAGAWSGVVVATANLSVSGAALGAGKRPDKRPAPEPNQSAEAPKLHLDAGPGQTPISGPTTRVSDPISSINTLEVYTADSGMMLGRTSEVVLTVTRGQASKLTSAHFVTPVGDQMCMARDDALRFIHITYPNWYASAAELSFEDKYSGHDGGSIGAAVGTLILSAIQGFAIDPNTAITGDISANGKVRAIGGLAAKIHGATASQCSVVVVPTDNFDQLTDAVIYNGPEIVTDIQVLGISNLDEAVAVMRVDRDAKLVQALALFDDVRQNTRKSPGFLQTKEAADKLEKILQLAPNHLSAKLLLMISRNEQPKTLSATASMYYTFVAVRGMLPILVERSKLDTAQVPSIVVKDGLAGLKKLRPMADESVRPLIDAWSRFIWGWSNFQRGDNTSETLKAQAQDVDDAMANLQADNDLMQKMLKEGI